MKTFILKHDNIIAIPCNMRVKCTLVYTELFCFRRGDVTITMHAIPHSGTRNEGEEPRMNMIWRIRSKMRQPGFVCDGATDHPDRWSRVSQGHKHPRLQLSCQFVQMAGEVHRDTERGDETLLVITQADPNAENVNGEDMQFAQNEPPCLPLGTFTSQNPPTRHCLRFVSYVCVPGHRYYPGERGNDPYERSKYALSHIWHEWPGMADIVAEMKEKESESGVYPKGAGPHAADAYAQWAVENVWGEGFPTHIPTTPWEAREFWSRYGKEHPGAVLSAEQTVAAKL